MTPSSPASTAFAYIDCDVPAGQTLAEWRRERDAARRAERPPRRLLRISLRHRERYVP